MFIKFYQTTQHLFQEQREKPLTETEQIRKSIDCILRQEQPRRVQDMEKYDLILRSLVFTYLWYKLKLVKPVPEACIFQIRSADSSAPDSPITADFVEIEKEKFIKIQLHTRGVVASSLISARI